VAIIGGTLPSSGPRAPGSPATDEPLSAPIVITVAYHSSAVLAGLAADLAGQTVRPRAWLLVDNAPQSAPVDLAPLRAAATAAATRRAAAV